MAGTDVNHENTVPLASLAGTWVRSPEEMPLPNKITKRWAGTNLNHANTVQIASLAVVVRWKMGRHEFESWLRPPEGRRIPGYPTGPCDSILEDAAALFNGCETPAASA